MTFWQKPATTRQQKRRRQEQQRARVRRQKLNRLRLGMETLEQRTLMANLLVTTGANAGAGSLREAVETANRNGQADLISFAPGVTSVTLSAQLTLTETGAERKVTITGPVTISGNNATGIFNVAAGAVAELSNLTLTRGKTSNGGAVINNGSLRISNSTLRDNLANYGGAIANYGEMTLVNSTVSGNHAEWQGGGIYNDSRFTATNSTIVSNRQGVIRQSPANFEGGGGIYATADATTTLNNSILANNVAPRFGLAEAPNDYFSHPSFRFPASPLQGKHNLIGDAASSGGLTNGTNGNLVGVNGSGVRDLATVLNTTLADNGGGVPTHALVVNGPAINAGDSALLPTTITLDQRGQARISGNGIDVGAFEHQFPPAPPSLANQFDYFEGLRIESTTDYDVTMPAANKQVRSANGVIQIGLKPVGSAAFVPLLTLTDGIRIETDTATNRTIISTGGLVSAVVGSQRVNLFRGLVDSDPNQRILIPLRDLVARDGGAGGYTIDRFQAERMTLSADSTFTPSQLFVNTATGQLELAGALGFKALGGAGVKLEGANRMRVTATGFKFAASSGPLAFAPAGFNAAGKAVPVAFELAGLNFQADTLTPSYDSSQSRFQFRGRAFAQFEGGSFEVEFGPTLDGTVTAGLEIAGGQLTPGRVFVRSLDVNGMNFSEIGTRELTFDAANKRITFSGTAQGRSKVAAANSVEFGNVGFGVERVPNDRFDTDRRVGTRLIVENGRVQPFTLPLYTLVSGSLTFKNLGNTPENWMNAEFSPTTGTFKITGQSQTLVREGRGGASLSEQGFSFYVGLSGLTVLGRTLPGEGLQVANGRLASFILPAERFFASTVFLRGVTTADSLTRGSLGVSFDTTNQVLSLFGAAQILAPTAHPDVSYQAIAYFGNSTNPRFVVDGKVSSRSKLEMELGSIAWGGTRFVGYNLKATFDVTQVGFIYSGQATWQYQGQFVSAVVRGSQGRLEGFALSDSFLLSDGLRIQGVSVEFIDNNRLRVVETNRSAGATVDVQGRVTPVRLIDGYDDGYNSGTVIGGGAILREGYPLPSNQSLTPRFEVLAPFTVDGVTLDSGVGRISDFYANDGIFTYSSTGTIRIGDYRSGGTVGVNLLTLNGSLLFAGTQFGLDAVTVHNIEFARGALGATYSSADRQWKFAGVGKYRGIQDVTVGGAPSNPQLILSASEFKLVNFTPPILDFVAAGLTFPTASLTRRDDGTNTILTGTLKVPVGAAILTMNFGANGTRGIIYNRTEQRVTVVNAELSGSFTIGGVKLASTGVINYFPDQRQYQITGPANATFNTSTGPVTLTVNLTGSGVVILDGQLQGLTATVTSGFKLFGLDVAVTGTGLELRIAKVGGRDEFAFTGTVGLSTPPIGGLRFLDRYQVQLGTSATPGLVVKNGELERIDITLLSPFPIFGVQATPENLRITYTRSRNLLTVQGGIKVTLANLFTAKAALSGDGLAIDLRTGQVQLSGLHFSGETIDIGILGFRQIEFDVSVNAQNQISFNANAIVALPAGLEVSAGIEIRDNRLKRIKLGFEKDPGIPISHPPVAYLTGFEGEVDNLDDIQNFSIRATIKGTIGPSVKIFGESRALVKVEGTIFVSREKFELSGKVDVLEGVLGTGTGSLTLFFSGPNLVRVNIEVRLYPGGIIRGSLFFDVNREGEITLDVKIALVVPEEAPWPIGGVEIGKFQIHFQTRNKDLLVKEFPNPLGGPPLQLILTSRQRSYFSVSGRFVLEFYAQADFTGQVYGWIDFFGKQEFDFYLPGTRDIDFTVLLDEDGNIADLVTVTPPSLTLDSAAVLDGTPGAEIRFTGTTQLPDDTVIELFVDTDATDFNGQLLTSTGYREGQQSFTWSDLAAYAPQPYDATKPLFVYGVIYDGQNQPVYSEYSVPLVPPDYSPSVVLPLPQAFDAGGQLVFSAANGNAIQVVDPLATPLPDAQVAVDVRAGHGTLELTRTSESVTVTSNGADALHLEGRAADITALLDGLVYTPAENSFFDDSFHASVSRFPAFYIPTIDTSVALDAHPLSIGLEPIAPPEPTGASPEPESAGAPNGTPTYVQGSGPATVLERVAIDSFASGFITGATIAIGDYVAGADVLELDVRDQQELGIVASFDCDAGVLYLLGAQSIESYERALHLVTFNSTGTGERRFTVSIDDGVHNSASVQLPLSLVTVNQAPVIVPGDGLVYSLGEPAAIVGGAVTVSDRENGLLTGATIALNASGYVRGEDLLSFTPQDGITGQFDPATGVLTLSGSASASAYTAALRNVRYQSLANPYQNRELATDTNLDGRETPIDALVVINDLNTSGPRELLGGPGEYRLDVTGDRMATALDALTVINRLNQLAAGPEGENALLTESPGARLLTITVSDGESVNGVGTAVLRLFVADRPTTLAGPSLTIQPSVIQAADDATPVVLAPHLTLRDPDNLRLVGAEVAVTSHFMAGEDELRISGVPAGITARFDALAGVMRLTGAATAADYELALQNVTYTNHATARDGQPRTVTFSVRDGFTSTPRTAAVTVEAEAKPTVIVGAGAIVYTDGLLPLEVDPDLIVQYRGGPTVTGATIAITENYRRGEDELRFESQRGITGQFDAATGVLTLSGVAEPNDYSIALSAVQYRNARVNPVPGTRLVSVSVHDGDAVGHDALVLVNVVTNYVPPLIVLDTDLSFTEGTAPLSVLPVIELIDQDPIPEDAMTGRKITGAVVSIRGYVPGEDLLSCTPSTGITCSFDADNGHVVLFGQGTLAEYQTVLRSVQYQNVSEAPTVEPRQLAIELTHGGDLYVADNPTLTIVSLNNSPTRLSAAPAPVTGLENAVSIPLSGLDYAPPSDKEPTLVYKVTQVPDAAFGRIALADGATAIVGDSYSLDQLRGATLIPTLGGRGTATFAFTVAGLNPILNLPDPAALTESVALTIAGIESTDANELVVAQIYRDLLLRNPTAAELSAGVDTIAAGTRGDFVTAVVNSTEYLALRVRQAYELLLHRAGTAEEVDLLVQAVQHDFLPLSHARSLIAGTQEYFEFRGSGRNDVFVTQLANDLLGRDPTESERTAWEDALAAGETLFDVAQQIGQSGSASVRTASGLFESLLRRDADLFEQVDAARAIQASGEAAFVVTLLASDEYFNRYVDTSLRDLDESQIAALFQQWLGGGSGGAVLGNTVITDGFESVGVISDSRSERGGGTLISSRHVLTAAHVVDGKDLSTLRFRVGGTTYGVSRVVLHPDYSPLNIGQDGANDIAVLELNRAVVDVTPARLLTTAPQLGADLTLVGHGPRPGDPGDGRSLTIKHAGETPIDALTPHLLLWTYDTPSEATTVEGDSGSGQFVDLDGDFYLASIASGGTRRDSSLGDQAYNTRVDAYFEWIDSVME